MMKILDLKTGLPEEKLSEKPIFEQYNLSKIGDNYTGTLVFADGTVFITVKTLNGDGYKWVYFTRLKPKGMVLLTDLLSTEFSLVKSVGLSEITSQNVLIWKSFVNGKMNEVMIGSGPYSGLPPVFQKIDLLINQYMYKMNEKTETE